MGVRTIDDLDGLRLREVRRALLHLLRYIMLDAIVIQAVQLHREILVHVLIDRYVGVEVDVLHRFKCCMAVLGYLLGVVVGKDMSQ